MPIYCTPPQQSRPASAEDKEDDENSDESDDGENNNENNAPSYSSSSPSSALNCDPSYWTTSLAEEADELREGTRRQTERTRRSSSKVFGLEAKLAEVMAASTTAAASFQELRNELETDNSMLKGEVEDLIPRVERSEERIDSLADDNVHLRGNVRELAERLSGMAEVFRSIEEQRLTVLRVTGDWEESLSCANKLVLIHDIHRDAEEGEERES